MSEQPRDRLGRPLRGADAEAFPGVVPRAQVSSAEAWSEAVDYLAAGLPFHAHEVLEQRWRCCPAQERPAWQACAQWAAALTHLARGNRIGAVSLARAALERLRSAPVCPEVIDVRMVTASLTELLG